MQTKFYRHKCWVHQPVSRASGTCSVPSKARLLCCQCAHQSACTQTKRLRRRQLAARRTLSASMNPFEINSDSSDYDKVLGVLGGFTVSQLREHVRQNPDQISLSFLEWLATRENELEGSQKLRLGVLAGQLMALREGLDPCEFDDVAEELQEQWQLSRQKQQQHQLSSQPSDQLANDQQIQRWISESEAMTSTSEVFPYTPASLQQSLGLGSNGSIAALDAFSHAGIAKQYEQVRLLNLDVQQAHAQSTVQLLGKKQVSVEDPVQTLTTAQRILDYLLSLPSAEARRGMLPEAFLSSENGMADLQHDAPLEGSDADTEQLATTPLQLLQAVDLELARLREGTSTYANDSKMLPSPSTPSTADLHYALRQLRNDVLDQWDAE